LELADASSPAVGSNGVALWLADEVDEDEDSDCSPSRRAEAALRANNIRELRSGRLRAASLSQSR
jgi:hypothetical protein